MITADFHNHTEFSSDSHTPAEEHIRHAIRAGLKQLCITDHMDRHYPDTSEGLFEFDPVRYFDTLTTLKERYQSRIELLFGIELGLRSEPEIRPEIRDFYNALVTDYPFDFVIGSTHVIRYLDPYLATYWETRSLHDGLSEYFESIAENAAWYSCFDVYGHLDYILRYAPDGTRDYRYEDYRDIADLALHNLVYAGKGIEINTSGLRSLPYPHPKKELLIRYRELGGEIITIGSDAHTPDLLGFEFRKAEVYLKECGFHYYTIFRGRKPVMERL